MRVLPVAIVGIVCAAMVGGASPSGAAVITLTQGALTVGIDDQNGTVYSLKFSGQEFYRVGTNVSDFGMQIGSDIDTFQHNTVAPGASGSGIDDLNVAVSDVGPAAVTAVGSFTDGASIDLIRTYSLINGNVLRTATTLVNHQAMPRTVRFFENYDPDQGVSGPDFYDTLNDALNLSTPGGIARVVEASSGLSVVAGSLHPSTVGGFLSSGTLSISGGTALNSFFAAPHDPNGQVYDSGFVLGIEVTLPGITARGMHRPVTFTIDQAFGGDADRAVRAFTAVQAPAIPAPTSLTGLVGMAAAGLIAAAWKRRRAAVVGFRSEAEERTWDTLPACQNRSHF